MATVLVIDDDEDVTRLLQSQLSEEGHDVMVAHQGDEGMAKALKLRPDLIMLDVFLPDSTGFQLCSQLRKNVTTQSVPIIMMTGAARFPNQQLFGMERGANEYISKPFDVIEIGELVNKYVGMRDASPTAATAASPTEAAVAVREERIEIEKETEDDLSALSSFWQESLNKKAANGSRSVGVAQTAGPIVNKKPENPLKISFMIPPQEHASAAPVAPAPTPAPIEQRPMPMPAQSPVQAAAPAKVIMPKAPPATEPAAPAERFSAGILASRERFIDFSMEIFALASRLSSTHAEKFLAENLLRTSMSVGARIGESRFAESKTDFIAQLLAAMKDLRETAYWLMLARKAGLLDLCAKADLEKTCQSLTTLLNDFLSSEKKRLSVY